MQPTHLQLLEYEKWSVRLPIDEFIYLKELKNKTMLCTCGEKIKLIHFRGYMHDGGIPDKNKILFWAFHPCFKCGYDWAWHKIQYRIAINNRDEERLKIERIKNETKRNR